ncbi:RraA family protein [Rhizobium sp. 21-4511-3d]
MNTIRLLEPQHRASAETIAKFTALPVATISDVMLRTEAGGPTLRPMHAGGTLCGPAFTVKTRPGDNLIIHKAIDMAKPGDVLVIDGGGDLTNSLMGEMMLAYAEKRGFAGVVVNGAIRDSAFIKAHEFPVFAAGVTHRGPYKNGPGSMNVPIALDGMVVEPGDLIVGDDDGLVSIPYAMLETVYANASKKAAAEAKQLQDILSGAYGPDNRKWVDKALDECGYDIARS